MDIIDKVVAACIFIPLGALGLEIFVASYYKDVARAARRAYRATIRAIRRTLRRNTAIRAWAKGYKQPIIIEADSLLYSFEVRM